MLLGWAIGSPLHAAEPPRIQYDEQNQPRVLIGLRGGPNEGRSRNATWAPVQVVLKAGTDDVTQGRFRLVVESSDGEAVAYRYTVPVPAIPANAEQVVFAYVRPGTSSSSLSVTLEGTDGQVVQTVPRLQRDAGSLKNEILEPRDILYLTVGAKLPALKRAVTAEPAQGQAEANAAVEDRPAPGFAYVESVADLPDRWFGYEAVDMVVLTTSGDTLVTQLLQDSESARRNALLDWVRRGGRLVLSVGRNQQAVARLLDRMPLLPCSLTGKVTRRELPNLAIWSGRGAQDQPLRQTEIACVKSGPGTTVLVREEPAAGDLERRPLVVQGSYGLGRVVLIAFDLDAPPFSTWEGQTAFWKKLVAEIAPRSTAANFPEKQGGERRTELAADLKRDLETFDEVPVISFGWVALFILFYIALIGPLDYFLLKKVFKRLELTWITFPVLVLLISAAAYATAYYFKGDDQRINKIDLVEYDLHEPRQVYGTSWFTLFSPRIQNYTVGLEPVAPSWAGSWGDSAPAAPVVVTTMDGPEASLGGNATGLFRRPYDYAPDAAGLERVPIPVWATRTFTASWRAPLPADGPPVAARLKASRDGKALVGTIANHLPVELQGLVLFYRRQWYSLGDLQPGEEREVSPLFEHGVKLHDLPEWFSDHSVLLARPPQAVKSPRTLRSLLFFSAGAADQLNSGLRNLDQGWRLVPHQQRYRDEVILVGRTAPRADRAETVARDGVSPTRLWLDHLPGSRPERPALTGLLMQETYVRVYVPVQPSQPQSARQP